MRLLLVLILAAAALITANTSVTLNSNSPSVNDLDIGDEERAPVPANLRQGLETAASEAKLAKAVLETNPVPVDPVEEEKKRIFDQYHTFFRDNGLYKASKLESILSLKVLYDEKMNFNEGVTAASPRVWDFVYSKFKNDPWALYAIITGAGGGSKEVNNAATKLTGLVMRDRLSQPQKFLKFFLIRWGGYLSKDDEQLRFVLGLPL